MQRIHWISLGLLLLLATRPAAADAIVALGSDLTAANDYLATLRQQLAARHIGLDIDNLGIAGDTTAELRHRIEYATPPGTRLLILEPGDTDCRNDRRLTPATSRDNVSMMLSYLKQQGFPVLVLGSHCNQAMLRELANKEGLAYLPDSSPERLLDEVLRLLKLPR